MDKFTPGPWKVGSKLDMSGWVIYHHGDKDNIASNVRAEDAYLITAAPDLLHVAKSIVFLCDHCEAVGSNLSIPAVRVGLAEAIAKAEGK